MRRALVVVLVTLLAFVAGCGSKSSSTTTGTAGTQSGASTNNKTHLAKTKFAIHAGLAFGAFHRYIYKPYKQGKFSGGIAHNKKAALKAALAAAFAYHETKIALNDARSSRVLSTVLKPLLALQTSLSSLRNGFHRGSVNTATINSANSDTSTISKESASKGQPIKDQPTPSLGG